MIKINLSYKVTKRIDAKRISLHPISQNENTVSIVLCVMKAFLDTIINMSLDFIHKYVIQDWITKFCVWCIFCSCFLSYISRSLTKHRGT